MACYRQNGKFVPTYESCSTSAFKHGRTETIRPASNATVACAESFQKSHRAGVEEMAERIRRAAEWHSKLTKEAAMGKCIAGSNVTPLLLFCMSRSFLSSSCHSLTLLYMSLPILPSSFHDLSLLYMLRSFLSSSCHVPPFLEMSRSFLPLSCHALALYMSRSSLSTSCHVHSLIRHVTVLPLCIVTQ